MTGNNKEKSRSKTPPSGSSGAAHKSASSKPKLPPHIKNKKSKHGALVNMKAVKYSAAAVVPVILGIAGYYLHMNYFYLPSLVRTQSHLPRILPDGYFTNLTERADTFWGTYRSSNYFGVKNRSPVSPVAGLIWYTQPSVNVIMPSVRHWCAQPDGLNRYGWLEHDGKMFGVQEIVDDDLLIHTYFVKRLGGNHGGDWTLRVEADTTNPAENDTVYAFIMYFAMDPSTSAGKLTPVFTTDQSNTQHVTRIDGQHPDFGQFTLHFGNPTNLVVRNFMITDAVDFAVIKEALITGTGFSQLNAETPNFYLSLMGYIPVDNSPTTNPRFVAVQFTVVKGTTFDVMFESGSYKRPNQLTGSVFDEELKKLRNEFNDKFEKTFRLNEKMQAEVYVEVGKHALSNMLGSMGFFHGDAKVQSPYNKHPVSYGPLTLFSTVPSRSFFPRGFLWDEGFHQLLIRRWNPWLMWEIFGSWLDLMNVEGWIPREVILGTEAEARVPAEFIIQQNSIANPPMFFYLVRILLDSANREENAAIKMQLHQMLSRCYPRLKAWYYWLNASQSGLLPSTYRWRGRNETTDRELNPKTLASGLDDYPRASHPTEQEYHVDLYSWMALSSKVMYELAMMVADQEMVTVYERQSKSLNDESLLNMLHWSQKKNRYCDYGLHTKNVKLERAPPELLADGSPNLAVPPYMIRVSSMEPKLRLVSDTFGYVSLFPLFLRLIAHDSPKLGSVLKSLRDPDLLWTTYGLRSLAKTAPLYAARNTEHDPPYWRGAIWINMNYLALASLHHYSQTPGPYRDEAFEIYAQLRNNLVTNVVKEYKRTGYLWEHYDDVTGRGEGSHPFTGWTSLLLLMMSEQYD